MDYSSQNSAQFNINPFQRYELALGPNIDRSQGIFIPEIEGDGLYVERADFPVQIALVNSANAPFTGEFARDGLQFDASFKGIWIQHPSLNVKGALSLIVRKGCTQHQNSLASPWSRFPLVHRGVTNSAVLQVYGIYVPPSVRALNGLAVFQPNTTITDQSSQFVDSSAVPITGPTSIQINFNGALVTYNQGNGPVRPVSNYIGPFIGATTVGVINFPQKVMVPTNASELQVSITGTGLTAGALQGWWE